MTLFKTIMSRNNTTLVAAKEEGPAMDCPRSARTFKLNYSSLIVAVFTVALCLLLLSSASAASLHKRRAIASATESNSVTTKECHQNTPCGWAIYIPFTRRIDYFMKNTCVCNSDLACVKTDDDLSVNAYVYRCKSRPLTTTENVPTTAEFIPNIN